MSVDLTVLSTDERVEFKLKLKRACQEFERQAQADGPTPYADCDNPEDATLDGHFDLEKVVLAIIGIHP